MIRKITKQDYPLLRDFLMKKLPTSMPILCYIEATDKYQIDRKIYVASCDPTLFIFATKLRYQNPCFCTFWDKERIRNEEVLMYLKSIPEWKWNETFFACRIESSYIDELDQMILESGLIPLGFRKVFREECNTFQLEPKGSNESFKPRLPEGYRLGKLKPSHAELVLSKWEFREDETASDYEEQLKQLPSAAVFLQDDAEDETPVSWCILYNAGYLGMTYTEPAYRRLGLGTAAEIFLCQQLFDQKLPATADIVLSNHVSRSMHIKAGFKAICNVTYSAYSNEATWIKYKNKA